jgi:hypothetical protein
MIIISNSLAKHMPLIGSQLSALPLICTSFRIHAQMHVNVNTTKPMTVLSLYQDIANIAAIVCDLWCFWLARLSE